MARRRSGGACDYAVDPLEERLFLSAVRAAGALTAQLAGPASPSSASAASLQTRLDLARQAARNAPPSSGSLSVLAGAPAPARRIESGVGPAVGFSDLAPAQPTGWSGPIVVSTGPGTHSNAITYRTSDTLYVDAAIGNIGFEASTATSAILAIDGVIVRTLNVPPLGVGGIATAEDLNLGSLSAGSHLMEFLVDPGNTLPEFDEGNNYVSYTFSVANAGGGGQADLAGFQPTGWSGPLVVSNVPGTNTDAAGIAATDPLFVDFALNNVGGTAAGAFAIQLLVDNNVVQTFNSDGLEPFSVQGAYQNAIDFQLNPLAAGPHTISVKLDSGNAVAEGNEANNTFVKQITVGGTGGGADLAGFQPPGWSGPVVVSNVTGTFTDAASIAPTDTIYVDFAFNNVGTVTAGASDVQLLVDNVAVATIAAPSVEPFSVQGAYLALGDYQLAPLASGPHTISIKLDSGNVVAEGNEANNLFSKQFTVTAPQPGSISGTVFEDLNANGARDAGEPPLVGWQVYLDADNDAALDPGETVVSSDASGAYLFTGLPPATYVVRQVVQAGFSQTLPSITGAAAGAAAAAASSLTTTGSPAPTNTYFPVDFVTHPVAGGGFTTQDAESNPLIRLNQFRADPRFSGINGAGYSVVILDSGIDLNSPFFGPDADGNGVADRIVFSYDFSGPNDPDASDFDGHGSNVSSIVAGQDATNPGMAPGANIIHLKVFPDNASLGASDADIEEALQWVVGHAAQYNIVAVNLSLGGGNFQTAQSGFSTSDEYAALVAAGVIPVAAAGNSFFTLNSAPGVAYPAADPNVLAVGGVFDGSFGEVDWADGSRDFSTGPDRIASITQRSTTLSDIFAPGMFITGAGATGGTLTEGGTSQASPHIAGIAALAQQLAVQKLGRRLTFAEFRDLLRSSGVTITDGDDENDNVTNTNATFKRVDVFALGEAILAMSPGGGSPGAHVVQVSAGQTVTGRDFGNHRDAPPNQPPAVGSLSDSPDPVVLGADLTLTANNVTDPDGGGTVASVTFYRETNGIAGLQTGGAGGDTQVGATDANGADGWSATFGTAGLTVGQTYTYYAQAADNQGAVSPAASATNTVQPPAPNQPPTIGSATANPNPAPLNGATTITANNVSDPDGSVVSVKFYQESNGVPGLQTGDDILFATDTSGADGWSTLLDLAGVPAGTYTIYALATDDQSATSPTGTAAPTVDLVVGATNNPPTVGSLSANPATVTAGNSVALTANNVADADAGDSVVSVSFYRESNGSPGLQTGTGGDTLISTDSNAFAGWTATLATAGLAPGPYTLYAQATDNLGAVSAPASTTVTINGGLSATPGAPDLLAASDTGASGTDDLTNLDNSSAARALQFAVAGTVAGALVEVLADGRVIGTATALGPATLVATAGALDLADGGHAITARQTEPGRPVSAGSAALAVAVDTVAPRVDGVLMAGSIWSADFLNWLGSHGLGAAGAATGGFRVPTASSGSGGGGGGAAQLLPLPWTNMNRVRLHFTEPLADSGVGAASLTLTGVKVPAYALPAAGFVLDPSGLVASWALAAGTSFGLDKLRLTLLGATVSDPAGNVLDGEWADAAQAYPSGNGAPGGDFRFRVNVVPGDANRGGATDVIDVGQAKRRVPANAATNPARYSIFYDVNANGVIDVLDASQIKQRIGLASRNVIGEPAGSPLAGGGGGVTFSAARITAGRSRLRHPLAELLA